MRKGERTDVNFRRFNRIGEERDDVVSAEARAERSGKFGIQITARISGAEIAKDILSNLQSKMLPSEELERLKKIVERKSKVNNK